MPEYRVYVIDSSRTELKKCPSEPERVTGKNLIGGLNKLAGWPCFE